MDGVQLVLTEGGLPLTVEDSALSEVDFGDSYFSNVVLRRVSQGEGATRFSDATAETITFEDVNMARGVSLAYLTAKSVSSTGGTFRGTTEGAK